MEGYPISGMITQLISPPSGRRTHIRSSLKHEKDQSSSTIQIQHPLMDKCRSTHFFFSETTAAHPNTILLTMCTTENSAVWITIFLPGSSKLTPTNGSAVSYQKPSQDSIISVRKL